MVDIDLGIFAAEFYHLQENHAEQFKIILEDQFTRGDFRWNFYKLLGVKVIDYHAVHFFRSYVVLESFLLDLGSIVLPFDPD